MIKDVRLRRFLTWAFSVALVFMARFKLTASSSLKSLSSCKGWG